MKRTEPGYNKNKNKYLAKKNHRKLDIWKKETKTSQKGYSRKSSYTQKNKQI